VRIQWHPLASTDLAELMTYIARDSLKAAYRMHDEIRRFVGKFIHRVQ